MRTPRTTAGPLAAVLLTVAFLLGACGVGVGPSPRAWAATVCKALTPWRTEINKLTSVTQQQITAKTTPAQAKENLVRLMAGAEEATETARDRVARAGVPDVDEGEAVARGFVASLTAVRDAYAKAKVSVEKLSSARSGVFYDGVQTVMKTLEDEYRASAINTSRLNSDELERAFNEVPECH